MSTEVRLDWGTDFVLTATGDLQVHNDANGNYPALIQRVIQMILTSPQLFDANNNPVPGSPDDIFNIQAGVGARRIIGNVENNALLDDIENKVLAGLANEPDVATDPQPQLEFIVYPNGIVLNLTIYAITGQQIPFPPIPITLAGA